MSPRISFYSADDWGNRLSVAEPPYNHIIKPGLYALVKQMKDVLQTKAIDFGAITSAVGVLNVQSALLYGCALYDSFADSVRVKWKPLPAHMDYQRIKEELNAAYSPVFADLLQKRAMISDANSPVFADLLKKGAVVSDAKPTSSTDQLRIVIPTLTAQQSLILTKMKLLDAVFSCPEYFLSCIDWPEWLFETHVFKKTK